MRFFVMRFFKALDASPRLGNRVGQQECNKCRLGFERKQATAHRVGLGCQACGSLNCPGSTPYGHDCDQAVPIQSAAVQAGPTTCDCTEWWQAEVHPVVEAEPMYGNEQDVHQQYTDESTGVFVDSVAPPVPEFESSQINVEEGRFESTPTLLAEPPLQPEPYVELGLNLAPPEQLQGGAVSELEPETGFLPPQRLADESEELAGKPVLGLEPPAPELDEPEPTQDLSGFASALRATEVESPEQKILQTKQEDRVVVLTARPVQSHKINNQSPLRRSDAIAVDRTDSYGLPAGRQVDFDELPPMDSGTRPRPINFQRNAKLMPPVKHLNSEAPPNAELEGKTTVLDNSNIQVAESTTDQPVDGEPMLRMTAVPYAGTSSLGAAIARIKVGKTPLIVRGAYPRDLEYERLAREQNEQATPTIIIPNFSLKTIDR